MKISGLLVFLLVLGGCNLIGRKARPVSDPEVEKRASPPSGETLAQHLRQRFPGVKSLSLVKLIRWTERTPGPCTADFAVGKDEARVDAAWETDDEKRSLRSADLSALSENGWDPAYRTPNGVGFEKLASFRAIDLTLHQTLECRCFGGARPVTRYPTEVRFRWTEGRIPEVSAAVERDGKSEGLRPALAAGRLVTYEFPVSARFPEGHAGSCDAHLAVTLLVDPAIR